MDRRKVLKQIAIATGGLITLPQWMISCGISDSNVHTTSFSSIEQQLLASVSDTIIPAGTRQLWSIGALSVGVDKYLQKLIDDCYEKDVQDNVKLQLNGLEKSAKTKFRKSFADCSQLQRQELLLALVIFKCQSRKGFLYTYKIGNDKGIQYFAKSNAGIS